MEYTITDENDGVRADRIVKNICSDAGYVFIQKLFRTHKVKVNGKKVVASDRVKTGDKIQIFANISEKVPNVRESSPQLFEKLKNMIIFENDDFFAINKPAGLAVQLGTGLTMCVETFIKAYPDMDCHLVHRLDKDTSGVLLIAKGQQAARKLTQLFRENKIQKTYLAIVDGKIKKAGVINNFLEKGNDEKMHVATKGQKAITNYKPLKSVGYNTMLELKPHTGRKHQLRVHCAEELKAPILGDKKYNKNPQHNKLFLHAYKLQIEDIEITAELPEHFQKMIENQPD